jgi:hypothetical protein
MRQKAQLFGRTRTKDYTSHSGELSQRERHFVNSTYKHRESSFPDFDGFAGFSCVPNLARLPANW